MGEVRRYFPKTKQLADCVASDEILLLLRPFWPGSSIMFYL